MPTIEPFALPPEDAIKWFREKGFAITWDWREQWEDDHARAFTVAKVSQLDVLGDIREAVDAALAEGKSFGQFKKELRPLLQKKGWWGEKELPDPQTGEVKTVQLGSARRLRIIYDTNMRTAHAAGKWQRVQDRKKTFPYLRYVPRDDRIENRRPEHQAFRDVVLPVDDPWWDTYYPLNGWGCECSVQQVNDRMVERLGLRIADSAPPIKYKRYENTRTGEVKQVAVGVSPGFGYNVGKGRAGISLHEIPPLTPSNSFRDYGRPAAREVTDRPAAPPKLPRVEKGAGKAERIREQFRQVFGTSDAAPSAVVRDPNGLEVVFDERVLPAHIARGSGREQYMNHARATVEDPYEIWLVPFRRKDGSVVIRQRYIGLFHDAGTNTDVMTVVGHNAAFTTYPHTRIDSERVGYLHYRRGDS